MMIADVSKYHEPAFGWPLTVTVVALLKSLASVIFFEK